MAKRVQRRRGTTSEHTSFTGYDGETTVDTTKDTVVVHDGGRLVVIRFTGKILRKWNGRRWE